MHIISFVLQLIVVVCQFCLFICFPTEGAKRDTCFKEIGCFSNNPPWVTLLRPIPPPERPEDVFTEVIFFSPNVSSVTITVYPDIASEIDELFDSQLPTFFICHGFGNTGYDFWLTKMASEILKKMAANVFLIDWQEGANRVGYLQAISNTRVVAAELLMLVKKLTSLGANTLNFHFIGHSLGAHVLAYVCKGSKEKIGWLTGLDPAGPGFLTVPKELRFDKNDAVFSDAIHTNSFQSGIAYPVAMVDFYFNGLIAQPGCIFPSAPEGQELYYTLTAPFYCSHTLSYEFYIKAIENSDCFLGRPFSDENLIKAVGNTLTRGYFYNVTGITKKCSQVHCVPMGLNTVNSTYRGQFLVTTTLEPPYCTF